MYINNILIDELSIHKFYIDIIEIRNNQLFLSGFLRSFFNSNDVEIKLLKGNDIFNGTNFNYDNRSESEFLESTINFKNTTTTGSNTMTTYLKATKELPHSIMAVSRAINGAIDDLFIAELCRTVLNSLKKTCG